MTEQKIKDHYRDNYSSSPIKVKLSEMRILLECKCECYNCGASIFEMEDFPEIVDEKVFCEDCYKREYLTTCIICEEYYNKPRTPKQTLLIITKETAADLGIKQAGFYQVKKYPFFLAATGFGVEHIFADSIKLLHPCNINSMFKKLKRHTINSGECCEECVNKYSGKTKLVNNYVNKKYGSKLIKLQKEVISNGY